MKKRLSTKLIFQKFKYKNFSNYFSEYDFIIYSKSHHLDAFVIDKNWLSEDEKIYI